MSARHMDYKGPHRRAPLKKDDNKCHESCSYQWTLNCFTRLKSLLREQIEMRTNKPIAYYVKVKVALTCYLWLSTKRRSMSSLNS